MTNPTRTITDAILTVEEMRRQLDNLLAMLYASQEQDVPVARNGKRVSFKERLNSEVRRVE